MRVFIATFPWFLSARNTDWLLCREISKLNVQFADIITCLPCSEVTCIEPNCRYLLHKAVGRLGRLRQQVWPSLFAQFEQPRVDRHEMERFAPDVVFAHGCYPRNTGSTPVLWETGFLLPDDPLVRQRSPESYRHEINLARRVARQAGIVALSNRNAMRLMAQAMPEIAHKLRAIPFYRPYMRPLNEEQVRAKHQEPGPVRILLVGLQARRKGAPVLVDAVSLVHRQRPGAVRLDIVSDFSDGRFPIAPDLPVYTPGAMGRAQTQLMFQRAHIYAMPSALESYGIAFIEAMAQGCVVLAPDRMPQREIIDEGRAGIPIDTTSPEAIAAALIRLVDDPALRIDLGLSALRRYRAEYHFDKVGELYRRALYEAAGMAR